MRILITGGSSEIAQAIARQRISLGDEIVVTASSEESLQKLHDEYSKQGLAVETLLFDLENPSASAERFEKHLARGIDGVVLNAASRMRRLQLFHEIDEAGAAEYFKVNLEGNLWLLRRVLPKMIEKKFGRLVLISSVSAVTGTSRFGYYCLVKSGLEGLFLNLAVDYAEHNILSNILRPGLIATERTRRFWKRTFYMDRMKEIIPQQALGSPKQVAEAIHPLLSSTSYMNGSIVTVSGGLPLMRSSGVLGL